MKEKKNKQELLEVLTAISFVSARMARNLRVIEARKGGQKRNVRRMQHRR